MTMQRLIRPAIHSKMSGDFGGGGSGASRSHRPVPRPVRWALRLAQADFISAMGSEIKKGDEVYTPSAPGYQTFTKADMVLAKLQDPSILT